ncbi:hypothetical protein [Thiolinea disciformis]|uniref:hypothetical protein n=1 Tax=Thiolinea disciformis TaxID=125614 RepID=UPI000373B6A0|nr:hypothetical protein [Thiolinea disciformis]
MSIMIIRENLTPDQVMAIFEKQTAKGNAVNINRLHSQLVEITITPPNNIIEINQYDYSAPIKKRLRVNHD